MVGIAGFAAALATAMASGEGAAAAPPASPSTAVAAPVAAPNEPASEQTYRLPLALAYATPLSLQVGTWFLPFLQSKHYSNLYTGLAFLGMALAPPIVHSAYDNSRAVGTSALGIFSWLGGGAAVGAATFVLSGVDVCRDCDDGVGEVMHQIGTGAAVGGCAGYLIWGVIDTVQYARVPQRARLSAAHVQSGPAALPWIVVVPAARGSSGVSLGLSGNF